MVAHVYSADSALQSLVIGDDNPWSKVRCTATEHGAAMAVLRCAVCFILIGILRAFSRVDRILGIKYCLVDVINPDPKKDAAILWYLVNGACSCLLFSS